jgi:hypothetical protein
MRHPHRLTLVLCVMTACAAQGTPGVRTAAPAGGVSLEERRALFDELVATVKKVDVFPAPTVQNLGFRWEDDVLSLRDEFLAADTAAKLNVALCHFGNSLHDAHCGFKPATPNGEELTLGFSTDVEWLDGRPAFYVSAVEDARLSKTVTPGDVVVSVDGVPTKDFLYRYRFTSNHGNWRSIAADVAEHLTRRRPPRWLVRKGEASRWELASRKTGAIRAIELTWAAGAPGSDRDDSDYAVDFERTDCDGLAERHYGQGYRIVARGFDYCVYASEDAAHRAYPVVRHFTFHYDGARSHMQHLLRAERDNLQGALAARGDLRGLIVDLRDNTGGNNANLFLDWYAPPAPYVGDFFFPRLDPALATPDAVGALVNLDGPVADAYLRAARGPAPNDPFALRLPDTWGPDGFDPTNRHVARHQVTAAPVALLVGPRCASSCDVVARAFAENGFGPLVGTPPAGVNSMIQLRRELKALDGRVLGELRIAFSRQASGKTGAEVQGTAPKMDVMVERTFDNADRYDAELVTRAIAALDARQRSRAADR